MARVMKKVALLALPRVIAMDFSIAAHVLGGHPGFALHVAGRAGDAGPEDGVSIVPTHGLDAVDAADVVVVPGFGDPHVPPPDAYLEAIGRAARRGATVVGICTGTFAVAASGAADGRKVTAHWRYTEQLRELYPRTTVVEDVLYVEDGNLLTSAGAGAGIDVCLHLIRTTFGAGAELEVGRELISQPTRPGQQPQYVDVLSPPRADLAETRTWAMQRLQEPLSVDRLARHAAMSRRTFIRRFGEETGMPPARWLTLQRVLVARRLLETSDWSVERIAAASGMGTAANFRISFRRETGSLPSDYRRKHGVPADAKN
ncbi:GlxA family transcriptional regulator [Streptomyces sp. NPDC101181]|uniref:GlxA family transcriptional regulator n=1 Tax=Streptomyces sp. NPDC101181 TaxID=3366125 RepID=UPI003817122B